MTKRKFLIDTDTASDDAVALIMALQHPDIEVEAITVVSGNVEIEQGVRNALYTAELCGSDVPVYQGALRPLSREPIYAHSVHGSDGLGDMNYPPPRCGPAQGHGAEVIVETIRANPGLVLVTLGPLTNVAMALEKAPEIAVDVSSCVIMGGVACTVGNITPAAEFNIWVDPEAARVVLRSGIPSTLSPLNVSRKAIFTREWYEKLVEVDTPLTRLIKMRMEDRFERDPDLRMLMYDQLAVATLIDPTLFKMEELYVDVDINHGINYGVSVGGSKLWPGAQGARKIQVEHDVDWDRFINLYIERMTRPVPARD